MNRIVVCAAFVAAMPLTLAASAASAHAVLEYANPGAGSSLSKAPAVLSMKFSEELEPAFSTVEVIDPSGKRVDAGDAKIDSSDLSQLQTTLKPLPSGTYKVIWHVVSADSHRTEGEFIFTVSP